MGEGPGEGQDQHTMGLTWLCVEVRWNYRLEEAADMDAEGQDEGPPCQALVMDCHERYDWRCLELSKNSSASRRLKD